MKTKEKGEGERMSLGEGRREKERGKERKQDRVGRRGKKKNWEGEKEVGRDGGGKEDRRP